MPLPPPKTKCPQDVNVSGWLRAGSSAGKGNARITLDLAQKPAMKDYCFQLCISVCFKQSLAMRTDKPSPGLLPAWGRAAVPTVVATGGHEAVRYGPASNTTLCRLYCILLQW